MRKEEISEKLSSKLQEIARSPATIEKVFSFSMEDLQDFPSKCLSEIHQYLTEYDDKIEDYWFTQQIDSDTFRPLLTMHILPVKSIAEGLSQARTSIWEKLSEIKISSDNI